MEVSIAVTIRFFLCHTDQLRSVLNFFKGIVILKDRNMRRQIKSGIWILPVLLTLAACTISNPSDVIDETPEIVSIETPVRIARLDSVAYPVYVRVSDPQGLGDIQAVDYSIEGGTDRIELADHGEQSDLIPNDGVYTTELYPDQFTSPGPVVLIMRVTDRSGNHAEALSDSIQVEDDFANGPPVLGEIQVPELLESDSLFEVRFSAQIEDPQGLGDIDSAEIRIYPPLSAVPIFRSELRDDGTGGDVSAQDGIFSLTLDLSDTLKGLGPHQVRFQAWDSQGAASLPVVKSITIKGHNDPPVLSGLNADDIVSRQNPNPFLISIDVKDQQGLPDIRRVYFNSTKPNGKPASGNPFIMHDDGQAGDEVAGDGTYSLAIQISVRNSLGEYRFTFYAEDLSGAVSEPLTHILIVVDEVVN